MVRNLTAHCLVAAMLVTFLIPGCQATNNMVTAWKERTTPKPKFKGLDDEETVTYWPYTAAKQNQKVTEMPGDLKDKLARRSELTDREQKIKEYVNEGDRLRRNGQLEEARIAYEKAFQISQYDPDVNHRLAVIADKQLRYAQADQYYQAALRVRPRDPNLLSDLGYSFYMRGDLDNAEMALKQALEINRSHPGAMANLGLVYSRQNRYSDAVAMFRAGTSTDFEAQQYLDKLFPRNGTPMQNGAPAGYGAPQTNLAMSSPAAKPPEDLSKLSMDQIRARMAQERRDAQQQRWQQHLRELAQMRNLPNDDAAYQSPQSRLAAASASDPSRGGPGGPVTIGPQGQMAAANSPSSANPPTDQRLVAMNAQSSGIALPAPFNDQGQLSADTSRPQGAPGNLRGGYSQFQQQRSVDPQIQQVRDQQLAGAANNNPQQFNRRNDASQTATQLGMNAGPGGMFPVVPDTDTRSAAPGDASATHNNRFGGEFAQPPAYQNSPNWGANSNDVQNSAVASGSAQIDGVPSVGPVSPTQNWGSPSSTAINWQDATTASTSWANQNAAGSGAAGTGIDSGVSLLRTPPASDRKPAPGDKPIISPTAGPRIRGGVDPAKQYNGTWPNTNSLPLTQVQQQNAGNNRSPDNMTVLGSNPWNGGTNSNGNVGGSQNWNGGGNSNSASSSAAPTNGSLPQYPYAPNR